MRVLVTGATSAIGRGVAQALLARGDDVRVLQRSASGLGVKEFRADLTDADAVRAAVSGVDRVVHLAAKVGITGSYAEFERVNVTGTQTLLRCAREAGVGGFVHVSSPSVAHAGTSLVGAGADPADATATRGHYARTKARAENWALGMSSPEFPVLVIRPHLMWGPGDTQLVGRIVERAKARQLMLIGDGAALIDTTYLTNAVDALVAAVDRVPANPGEVLVVSNGEPRPVVELVTGICRAAGVPPPTRSVPRGLALAAGALVDRAWSFARRTDEPPLTRFLAEQLSTAHWFDQRHTREVLGWEPRVSIADGFELLAASFRSAGD